jgi:uncharacterized membrane protein
MEKRRGTFREIMRPWFARLFVGASVAMAFYQFACDQFGAPTLPKLWGMTGFPWWGWLLVAQAGFVYALFEYVRRNIGGTAASEEAKSNPRLEEQFQELQVLVEGTLRPKLNQVRDRGNSVDQRLDAQEVRFDAIEERLKAFERHQLDLPRLSRMLDRDREAEIERKRQEVLELVEKGRAMIPRDISRGLRGPMIGGVFNEIEAALAAMGVPKDQIPGYVARRTEEAKTNPKYYLMEGDDAKVWVNGDDKRYWAINKATLEAYERIATRFPNPPNP